jgi:ankyrin repeat protein
MNICILIDRLFRSLISRYAAGALFALAGIGLAFCGSIYEAAAAGDAATVKAFLLGNSGLAFSKDAAGETPLHIAVLNGHKIVAELLLTYGANVGAKDNYGLTPLHAAAAGGCKEAVELLLTWKADVNAKDNDGDTPLHAAVAGGNKDIIELLRRNGGRE